MGVPHPGQQTSTSQTFLMFRPSSAIQGQGQMDSYSSIHFIVLVPTPHCGDTVPSTFV